MSNMSLINAKTKFKTSSNKSRRYLRIRKERAKSTKSCLSPERDSQLLKQLNKESLNSRRGSGPPRALRVTYGRREMAWPPSKTSCRQPKETYKLQETIWTPRNPPSKPHKPTSRPKTPLCATCPNAWRLSTRSFWPSRDSTLELSRK